MLITVLSTSKFYIIFILLFNLRTIEKSDKLMIDKNDRENFVY